MPRSSAEAALELRTLMKERNLTQRSVSTRLGKSEVWISRRLGPSGRRSGPAVRMTIDDYTMIKDEIEAAPAKSSLF